jgi:uncharacterized protein YlbG (UPF0298 family)
MFLSISLIFVVLCLLSYLVSLWIFLSYEEERKEYRVKSKPIIVQMLEVLLVPFDIIVCFIEGYIEGKLQYCMHNTFVNMSRKYGATYVIPWSLRNLITYSLAQTFSDITGKLLDYKFVSKEVVKNYTYHLNPLVRNRAKKILIFNDGLKN